MIIDNQMIFCYLIEQNVSFGHEWVNEISEKKEWFHLCYYNLIDLLSQNAINKMDVQEHETSRKTTD